MIYQFKCEKCGVEVKENRGVSNRDNPIICQCGGSMSRMFNSDMNFALAGWGWTGRDYKEKRTREQHSVDMAVKQHERYGDGPSLVPNYRGNMASSWSEVRDQAITEKGSSVAPQYATLIEKEKSGRKSVSQVIKDTVADIKG
jgi:putative FmdB family regulatory protein